MADADIWGLVIWFIIIPLVLGLGFFIARFMDAFYRCKKIREFTKKNYVLLGLVQKDNKTVSYKVVNADKDTIMIDNNLWVVERNRIYRQEKPEDGFGLEKNNLKWVEGVPCVFVNRDNIKPLDFFQERNEVKSEEVGSVINAFVYNQIAKALGGVNSIKTLLTITLVFCLIAAILSYMAFDATSTIKNDVKAIKDQLGNSGVITAGSAVNGTITIRGS